MTDDKSPRIHAVADTLNDLSELETQRMLLEGDKTAKKDAVLTDDQRVALAEIDLEYGDKETTVASKIAEIRDAIANEVKELGATVKGDLMQAVFSERATWDNKALDGYAAAHPEIKQFKKTTRICTIRKVGEQ